MFLSKTTQRSLRACVKRFPTITVKEIAPILNSLASCPESKIIAISDRIVLLDRNRKIAVRVILPTQRERAVA